MAQLLALCQFRNRDVVAAGESLDGKQGLVLLRRQARLTGGVLAEIKKPAPGVPQGSQRFVV
jgi:hypothetical protein